MRRSHFTSAGYIAGAVLSFILALWSAVGILGAFLVPGDETNPFKIVYQIGMSIGAVVVSFLFFRLGRWCLVKRRSALLSS